MAIANGVNSVEPKLVMVEGQKRRQQELGYKGTGFVYNTPCPNCGVEHWRTNWQIEHTSLLCANCANAKRRHNSPNIRRGIDIGLKDKEIQYKDTCPQCGKDKWVAKDYLGSSCKDCNTREFGERSRTQILGKHPRWTGGRYQLKTGYVVVTLPPDSPFISMATGKSRRVFEHRLVMAEFLGRPLEKWEVVHHKNGNRSYNRNENLELLPNRAQNNAYTALTEQVKSLQSQVDELTKFTRLLMFLHNHNQYGNTEPSRDTIVSPACVETRNPTSSNEDDGIVHPS